MNRCYHASVEGKSEFEFSEFPSARVVSFVTRFRRNVLKGVKLLGGVFFETN